MSKVKCVLGLCVAVGLVLGVPTFAQDADVDPMGPPVVVAPADSQPSVAPVARPDRGPGVAEDCGQIHYSARLIPPEGGRANVVYIADGTGTIDPDKTYNQIAGAAGDAWGYRDGASDGEYVYFGWGGGVARHDLDGGNPTLMFGPGICPGGTCRALAYDPTGDDGKGSFWVATWGSSLDEVDMAGNLLNSFPVDGWSLYGLAYDDKTGNLWGHSRTGLCNGCVAETIEIDTTTGLWTGVCYPSGFGVPGDPNVCPDGAIQGGLSMCDSSGILYNVLQGTPDSSASYDTAGNLAGGLSPNPRDLQGQTGNPGHLGVAVVGEGGGENCDGRNPAKLNAKCKSGGKKVIAKLKKAAPNTDVTFEIDGGDHIDKTTNRRGKAKGKFKRQARGEHTVTVCDLEAKCSP